MAKVERECPRCHKPWGDVKTKKIPYEELKALNVVCESCFNELSANEIGRYVSALLKTWKHLSTEKEKDISTVAMWAIMYMKGKVLYPPFQSSFFETPLQIE